MEAVDGQKEIYMDRSVPTPTSALPEARELLSPQMQTEGDQSLWSTALSELKTTRPLNKCQGGVHMHRPHLPLEEAGGKQPSVYIFQSQRNLNYEHPWWPDKANMLWLCSNDLILRKGNATWNQTQVPGRTISIKTGLADSHFSCTRRTKALACLFFLSFLPHAFSEHQQKTSSVIKKLLRPGF